MSANGITSDEYDFLVKKKVDDDSTYVAVGCVTKEANMLNKGKSDVVKRDCKDKGQTEVKTRGIKRHADGSVTYAYTPKDTAGKKILNDADESGEELTIKMLLGDEGATHSTYIERDVFVTEIAVADSSNIWEETVSLEFLGSPRTTVAD